MFPLLLIPFAVVNITAFLMPDSKLWETAAYTLTLPSLTSWTFTYGDALLAFSMFLLIFEVAKAARPGAKFFTDHLLSFIVFAGATAEFLMLPPFGHSTFMLLTMLAFVDVVAGIMVRTRRPKVAVVPTPEPVAPVQAERPLAAPVVVEPMPNPTVTPPPPVPGANPVIVRPVNDLEIVPPKSDAILQEAQDKHPDEPTVIPQR